MGRGPPMADFASVEETEGLRLAWNVWPNNRIEATKCVLPFGALYTPTKALQNLPVRSYSYMYYLSVRSVWADQQSPRYNRGEEVFWGQCSNGHGGCSMHSSMQSPCRERGLHGTHTQQAGAPASSSSSGAVTATLGIACQSLVG